MRESGLKSGISIIDLNTIMSLPMRESGLKCMIIDIDRYISAVSPYAGEWIEILNHLT